MMTRVRIVDESNVMIEVRSYDDSEAFVQVSQPGQLANGANTVYLNPDQVRALRKALKKALGS